jgi:hypothetical protein
MRVAKATEEDFDNLLNFLQASENVLDREHYSLNNAESNYKQWDEDDADRILIEKYRETIAAEDRISIDDVDDRAVMYMFLKNKFFKAASAWRRVYYAGIMLIDAVCDPTEHHLAYHPGIQLNNVAPEQ